MLSKSTAPHVLSKTTTRSIMLDVIIALVPSMFVAVLFFGINSILVIVTSVAACVMFEYLYSTYCLNKRNTTLDLSAVLTGILLAFSLPASLPLWMVVIGAFVAIVIAKMIFGGLGMNLFNPALVGRTFLFLSFPVEMTLWQKPNINDFWNYDVQTGATALEVIKYSDVSTSATRLDNASFLNEIPNYLDMFLGRVLGSLGEISVVALLIGFVYLLYRKIITWHIPVIYILSVFVIMFLISINSVEEFKYNSFMHILSGGVLLGAIFMATDYTTSPMSIKGKVVFALGCGGLTVLIRLFSVYTEGVAFAILIMNAFVPLIDKYTVPKIFGTGRR